MLAEPMLRAVISAVLRCGGAADAGGVGVDGEQRDGLRVLAPAAVVAEATASLAQGRAAIQVLAGGLDAGQPDAADVVLLLDDELPAAGAHAEERLAEVELLVRRGGLVALSAPPPPLRDDGWAFDAEGLRRMLGHRGFDVVAVWAPGAAARLRDEAADFDPAADARPGLLDAGEAVVAVGRRARSADEHTARFFGSLPTKVVTAAVVCRDGTGRLLCVYDSFRQHWTIPGGVVDAQEDPRDGGVREAWEEAGVAVRAGALLGVFGARRPDRLTFVYAAEPVEAVDPSAPQPVTQHPHEIAAVEWVPLDEALTRVSRPVRAQLLRCLEEPGRAWPAGTWRP